jgi:hypothetical protein
MNRSRAVFIAILIAFVAGFILAGYNGTAIYIWHTTGKIEILGSLEDRPRVPIYFTMTLILNFGGFLIGVCLLIFAIAEFVVLSKSLIKKRW